MPEPASNRRRFPRLPLYNPVLVKTFGGASEESLVRIRSVSLGGCKFLHGESLGKGALLDLLISLGETVIEAKGQVVYEIPREDGTVEIGVEFLEVPEADRATLAAALRRDGVTASDHASSNP